MNIRAKIDELPTRAKVIASAAVVAVSLPLVFLGGVAHGERTAPVTTKVLALSDACEATIEAARTYVDTAPVVTQLEGQRSDAGDEYIRQISSGDSEAIEDALADIDDVESKLSGAKTTLVVAGREFSDRDNECLTEIDRKEN